MRDTLISCLLHAPNWGPCPQSRHVTRPGIKPATLCSQAGAQSTEPHQPGPTHFIKSIVWRLWSHVLRSSLTLLLSGTKKASLDQFVCWGNCYGNKLVIINAAQLNNNNKHRHHFLCIRKCSKPGVGKFQSVDQIWLAACFQTA